MVLLPDQIGSVFYRCLSVPKKKQLPELETYRKRFTFQVPEKQYYFSNVEQNTILPRVPYSVILVYQCFAISCAILANALP
jgi:hypothetical protein